MTNSLEEYIYIYIYIYMYIYIYVKESRLLASLGPNPKSRQSRKGAPGRRGSRVLRHPGRGSPGCSWAYPSFWASWPLGPGLIRALELGQGV